MSNSLREYWLNVYEDGLVYVHESEDAALTSVGSENDCGCETVHVIEKAKEASDG